jgi:predicted membrane channel-forming protein YqfA (hemolysin III family)
MNKELFKEPGGVFALGALISVVFLFVESRYQKRKKTYRDYIVYSIFVGSVSAMFVHLALHWTGKGLFGGGGGKMGVQNATVNDLFIRRFPG